MNDEWMESANCIGVSDPDAFFPERGRSVSKETRALCATCPVQAACLQYAAAEDLLGFWGGVTESKRQALPGGRRGPGRGNHSEDVCRNGHPRTEANTVVRKSGQRLCRVCQRATQRRAAARAKAGSSAA